MEHVVESVSLAGLPRRKRNHSLQHIKDVPRFSNRDLHSNLERVDFQERIEKPMKLIKVISQPSQMTLSEMSTKSLFLH